MITKTFFIWRFNVYIKYLGGCKHFSLHWMTSNLCDILTCFQFHLFDFDLSSFLIQNLISFCIKDWLLFFPFCFILWIMCEIVSTQVTLFLYGYFFRIILIGLKVPPLASFNDRCVFLIIYLYLYMCVQSQQDDDGSPSSEQLSSVAGILLSFCISSTWGLSSNLHFL